MAAQGLIEHGLLSAASQGDEPLGSLPRVQILELDSLCSNWAIPPQLRELGQVDGFC